MFKITPAFEGAFPGPAFFEYDNVSLHIVMCQHSEYQITFEIHLETYPLGDKENRLQYHS